jgi:hypothetical protein
MKTRKMTKNELLKLIRESKHDHFEAVEPVTPETVGHLLPRLKQLLRDRAFLPLLVYPSD